MKRRVLGILTVLSLLFFLAVVWMGMRSFHENTALLSWMNDGFRYTLRSHWGELLVVGPPVGNADAELEAIAGRMSSSDFDWTVVAGYVRGEVREVMQGRGYVQGEVREGTPTWEMYERVRDKLGTRADLGAEKRAWVRGLEDPQRFPSCHLMLLLAQQDEWRERYVDGKRQPWHDASAAGGRLILFVHADESGTGPELSGNALARERWGLIVDEARVRMFYGWLALAALVLPVAWLARPRREPRTVGRWMFNGAALVSVFLLAAAVAAWVRSYRTTEQWTFAARYVEPPAGIKVPVRAQSWVGSTKGRMIFSTHEAPETRGPGSAAPRYVGYRLGFVDTEIRLMPGMIAKDERRWSVPGTEYARMPVQELRGPGPTPGTMYLAFYGYRHLVVSWWVPVVLCALLPLTWLWRHWRWRRRARRVSEKLCVKCGYDLRASAERCPECGEAIAAAAIS